VKVIWICLLCHVPGAGLVEQIMLCTWSSNCHIICRFPQSWRAVEPVREIDVTTHGIHVNVGTRRPCVEKAWQIRLNPTKRGPYRSGLWNASPSSTEATLLKILDFLEAFVGKGLADRCTAQSEQASRAATPVDSVSEPSRSSMSPNVML
jgi:hypothetical protein